MNIQPRHTGIMGDTIAMGLAHEATPHGVNPAVAWYNTPALAQGMQPNNSLIGWWPGPNFPAWRAIIGWWIAYQATSGHAATNSAIEISGEQLAVLRKSGQWEILHREKVPAWFGAYAEDAVAQGDPTPWSAGGLDGGLEVQPAYSYLGAPQAIHGGTPKLQLWSGTEPDFDAIHMVVRHRLTLKNRGGTDDRANANFVLQAGADYWPSVTTVVADLSPAGFLPGVGCGRFTKVKNYWRLSTFLVSNPGIDIVANPPPSIIF